MLLIQMLIELNYVFLRLTALNSQVKLKPAHFLKSVFCYSTLKTGEI